MRVLQLIKTTRGASWALRQVRVLLSFGVDVHVALPDDGGLASAYRDAGAQVHIQVTDIARLKNPAAFWAARRAFRELVSRIAPDVIHSHFVGTTLFMRLALGRSGPPRIFQVPGPLHLENPVTRLAEIGCARRRDQWIASCRFTRDVYLASGVDPGRVGLSYYGIDLDAFTPRRPAELKTELRLSSATALIGMVAYIYPPKRFLGQTRGLKGHEDLIDAVRLLREAGRDCAVVFVGGPWAGAEGYEVGLKAYAEQALGTNAVFLGDRQDVADLYLNFDVAVHPSHSENLGGAVESLALGVPTVATDVGGFPDVVIPGETGWLAPPRRPDDLAQAIGEALDDPARAKRYAENGARRVRELLNVENNGREVLGYYQAFTTAAPRRD